MSTVPDPHPDEPSVLHGVRAGPARCVHSVAPTTIRRRASVAGAATQSRLPRPPTRHLGRQCRRSRRQRASLAEAERRQLTVLFCDLVDSTRLARQLDPKTRDDVIRAYQQTCAAVIQRFDGYIAVSR